MAELGSLELQVSSALRSQTGPEMGNKLPALLWGPKSPSPKTADMDVDQHPLTKLNLDEPDMMTDG